MTESARTFRLVKTEGWKKDERENFAGRMVELIDDGRKDHRHARTYRMLEGPLEGQEVWFTEAELTDFPRDVPTGGDW